MSLRVCTPVRIVKVVLTEHDSVEPLRESMPHPPCKAKGLLLCHENPDRGPLKDGSADFTHGIHSGFVVSVHLNDNGS